VFSDRLINVEDANWYQDLAISILSRHFKSGWEKEEIFGNPILFSDILKLDMAPN